MISSQLPLKLPKEKFLTLNFVSESPENNNDMNLFWYLTVLVSKHFSPKLGRDFFLRSLEEDFLLAEKQSSETCHVLINPQDFLNVKQTKSFREPFSLTFQAEFPTIKEAGFFLIRFCLTLL